jgi:transcriptional regulator with XRE-family HTH domain/tetratricopeptide (TPR) repeat protein
MSVEPDRSFGELLLRARVNAGLTQDQLADRAGLSVRTIRNLERGTGVRPREASARLLADALELTGAARGHLLSTARSARLPGDEAPPRQGRVPPRQLPAAVRAFTGREAELDALNALRRGSDSASGTMPISVIDGMAGIGKTTLAVHWAHQAAEGFPDGQLYVNLRGFDPDGRPLRPAEAIRGFLDALISDPGRIPARPDAQNALYRSLLADTRTLVVLDNARDAEQVRPLLPGSAGCLVLVTSRRKLTSLTAIEGAHQLTLDLLTPAEAYQVLADRLGPGRAAEDPEAMDELIGLCARLPLALGIAAARAAADPALSLTDLAAELHAARNRLDALDLGDSTTDLRAVFSWSYRGLGAPAARLFRLLGLHAGPDITAAAAASLAGLSPAETGPALAELVAAQLMTEHRPGRYAFHDLLRAYAAELAHSHDGEAEQHAATHRVLDHYLHSAHAAARLVTPTRSPIPLDALLPATSPEDFQTDDEEARSWLEAERPVLMAAIAHAAAQGFDRHVGLLAWVLANFLDQRAYWYDYFTAQRIALSAAQRLGEQEEQARAHRFLGSAHARLRSYEEAHTHLRLALDLHLSLDDRAGEAHTELAIGSVLNRQRQHGEALGHILHALKLYRAESHGAGEADCLNAIGWVYSQLEDYSEALRYCTRALGQYRELNDRFGQAHTADSLGYIHDRTGDHESAIVWYEQALGLYRVVGDRYSQSTTLDHIGDTRGAMGDTRAAQDAWRAALALLDELEHPDAERVRTKLLNHP